MIKYSIENKTAQIPCLAKTELNQIILISTLNDGEYCCTVVANEDGSMIGVGDSWITKEKDLARYTLLPQGFSIKIKNA